MFHDFNVQKTSLFTWTSSARNWRSEAANVHAIGAPWLYLTKGERQAVSDSERIPLFVPRHGTRISGAGVDYKVLASSYASRYGAGKALLHADDAHDQSVQEAWESAGHIVTFSKSRFDPDFLMSTWENLSGAQVVISDGISTSLLYAASLGVEIEISDHNAVLPWLAKYDEQLKAVFPEFYQSHPMDSRRDVAMAELGQADIKPKEDLKALLTLDSPLSISASASYWFYSPIRKVVKVLSSESSAESALADSHWTDWLRRPMENLPRVLPKIKNSSIKQWVSAKST